MTGPGFGFDVAGRQLEELKAYAEELGKSWLDPVVQTRFMAERLPRDAFNKRAIVNGEAEAREHFGLEGRGSGIRRRPPRPRQTVDEIDRLTKAILRRKNEAYRREQLEKRRSRR